MPDLVHESSPRTHPESGGAAPDAVATTDTTLFCLAYFYFVVMLSSCGVIHGMGFNHDLPVT